MKKILVILIALAVVGFFAFADDAAMAPAPQGQFHAWNFGEFFPYLSSGGGSAQVGWGPDWDPNGGVDQEWTFSYDGKGYGFAGTFEFGMGNFGQSTNGWGAFQSWNVYFDVTKYAKFSAGQLDVGDYRYTTFIEGGANSRFGQRSYSGMLQLFPIDGLSLAVLEEVPGISNLSGLIGYDATGKSYNASGAAWGTVSNTTDYGKYTNFAASYEMKDVAKAYFAYNASAQEISIGVNVSALKPLGLQVVYDDDYASGVATSTVWLTASYPVGPLALSLDAGFMSGDYQNMAGTGTAMAAEIQGKYTMGQVSVGANIGYDDGKGIGLFGGQAAEWTGLEVYPFVQYNFDNGSDINIGILYASGANAGGGVLEGASWNAASYGYSASLFAIPITFTWSF